MSRYYVVAVTARKSLVHAKFEAPSRQDACRQFLKHPATRICFSAHVLRCGDTGQRLTTKDCRTVVQSQMVRECLDPSAAWKSFSEAT